MKKELLQDTYFIEDVSILLILDVADEEEVNKAWKAKHKGFNPSYSGCC